MDLITTLSPSTGFNVNSLAANQYRQYVFIFDGIYSSTTNSTGFGAQLFIQNDPQQPHTGKDYYSVLWGNDFGGNNAESHNDTYLRLWSSIRSGPGNAGIVGTMTLYAGSALGYIAHLYAQNQGVNCCQIWVEGGLGSEYQVPVDGITFGFFDGSSIKSGSISVYGWS